MTFKEYNFDGLVGLSHHYGGHSFGNVASSGNAALVSNPKQAALQGLLKAKTLADMGLENGLWGQAILPPQERPFMPPAQLTQIKQIKTKSLLRNGQYLFSIKY